MNSVGEMDVKLPKHFVKNMSFASSLRQGYRVWSLIDCKYTPHLTDTKFIMEVSLLVLGSEDFILIMLS